MLIGEVAPAAPALGPLIALAVLLVAFGIVYTARRLLNALFGWLISTLEAIPVIGDALAGPFKSVEQAVAHALGTAEQEIDKAMGASWHLLARYMEWLWRETRGSAILLLHIASYLPVIGGIVAALRALVHHGAHTNTAQHARIKRLEREYHGIDKQLRTLEKEFHGIDETGLGKQVQTLDKELAKIEAQTIPAIQQADSDAATAIGNLYDWVKGKASILGVGTITTAVAAALGALGLDWIKCKEGQGLFNRRGCGLWNDLDGLLGLFVDLFVLSEVCDVLPVLDAAVSDVATPLVVALTDVGAGLCSPDSSPPAALTGPAYVLPPVYFTGKLQLA